MASISNNKEDTKICKSPIIFLDTAILLEASKNETPFKELIDLVIQLSKDRKIIAIEGAQRDEICHGKDMRGIGFLKKHCHATYSFDFIQKKQLFRAACNYIENKSSAFILSIEDIFLQDPSITGTSGLGRITDSEALCIDTDKILTNQARLHELLRKTAITSKISYQQERKIGLEILIDIWKIEPYLYGVYKVNSHKLNDFWTSKFFTEIPYIYLWSSLYASIITAKDRQIFNEEIKAPIKGRKGDWVDLISISTLLPYCDYFTCDKNMKDMVRQFSERDKNNRYFKKLYSSSKKDIEELIKILKTI